MCGIAGFYAPNGLTNGDFQSNIQTMLGAIKHRGPDAGGVWSDKDNKGLFMGHRRLSIIDLTETGSQPMMSHSGRYVIVYNGEIYNTRRLKDELRGAGYSDEFRGTSDTEVLLESIATLGIDKTLSLCKGMFAFALYDIEEHELTLARDRAGEKPLYYGYCDGSFVYASEIGAIRSVMGSSPDLNYDCIADYLKYGYIPAPLSIYKNIYKLEPGCGLKVKCEINKFATPEYFRYWDPETVARQGQSNLFSGSRKEAADILEELLKESVKGQMVSDVPLGAFLSAGIDSPTVVALMQAQSSVPVRTFTIGFEEASYNEADAAALIAKHLGTDHTQLYATAQDALDAIPLMSHIFGEPFADSSQIPTYLVSRLTRQHVTVSLSGDGGDELFAGYRDHGSVRNIYERIRRIPRPLRTMAGSLMEHVPGGHPADRIRAHGTLLKGHDPADLYRRTYETWRDLGGLLGDAVLEGRDPDTIGDTCIYDHIDASFLGDDAVHTAMYMNTRMYLPDDILTKVDRTAMAVSLETRIPMLDRDVIEFAWTLPLEYLRDGDTGKLILRDVLYRYIPREIMDRPKKGFGVPVSEWLRGGQLKEWASDLLNPDSINQHKILSSEVVGRMWNDYINKGIWRPQIWYVLMLADWLKENT